MFIKTQIKNLIVATLLVAGFSFLASPAFALQYQICKSPQQSMPCAVAFEKLRTYKNPITKEKFFEDEVHIKGNKLLTMPALYVANPDLDKDGVKEIIIALSEAKPESKGLFCQSKFKCPHFVIQNRNVDLNKPRLRYYSLIGATYAHGIGLSTDEALGGYQSLRVYKNNSPNAFHTYQYDKETDKYHDLGKQEARG